MEANHPVVLYFFKKEKVVCVQFVFWSTGQWRKDEEEVNIQRHSLTVRDTDMFSRTWQKHWKKKKLLKGRGRRWIGRAQESYTV